MFIKINIPCSKPWVAAQKVTECENWGFAAGVAHT